MGAVQKLRDIEDEWAAKATLSSIEAARNVVGECINSRSMVYSLSDVEWGWIASAIVFAWVKTKSEQAVAQGIGYDNAIRAMPNCKPQPWEAGAISTILPALAGIEGVDWGKPLEEWSKPQIIFFIWQAYQLVGTAFAMRDIGAADKLTQKSKGEMNDDIPF